VRGGEREEDVEQQQNRSDEVGLAVRRAGEVIE